MTGILEEFQCRLQSPTEKMMMAVFLLLRSEIADSIGIQRGLFKNSEDIPTIFWSEMQMASTSLSLHFFRVDSLTPQ